MEVPRKPAAAFTITELLVVIVVIGVLALLLVPKFFSSGLDGGDHVTQEIANARSLTNATAAMAFDGLQSAKVDRVTWTSVVSLGKSRPATLAEYFAALTRDDAYLSEEDLRKLLAIKGRPPKGPLTADNIGFRFFWVEDESPASQPFMVTANWRDGKLFDRPYPGLKGCVYYTKGGGGGAKRTPRDGDPVNIFPEGSEGTPAYHHETLK